MSEHPFIFKPGLWKGEGTISFSMAEDQLPFTMRWSISSPRQGKITLSQVVEVKDFNEPLVNYFSIFDLKEPRFSIILENHLVEKIQGQGIYDSKRIAWEFQDPTQALQGFEIYEIQQDGTYKMRAEFYGGDDLKTLISGRIFPA